MPRRLGSLLPLYQAASASSLPLTCWPPDPGSSTASSSPTHAPLPPHERSVGGGAVRACCEWYRATWGSRRKRSVPPSSLPSLCSSSPLQIQQEKRKGCIGVPGGRRKEISEVRAVATLASGRVRCERRRGEGGKAGNGLGAREKSEDVGARFCLVSLLLAKPVFFRLGRPFGSSCRVRASLCLTSETPDDFLLDMA